MVDSSVKNHGEAEYDIQNCLRNQEIQVWPKFRSEVYLFLLLYINRYTTKKFPIEILLEMMDSSVRSLGEVEYDDQNCLKHQKNPVRRKFRNGLRPLATVHKSVHNKNVTN